MILTCGVLAAQTTEHQTNERWTLTQDAHFEVYSQAGDETAQKALVWFERLRAFFEHNGLLGAGFNTKSESVVRVIGFRSAREYEEFRLRPTADAYYIAEGSQNYIVMATLQSNSFNKAAHEYAHYVLHARSLNLPACLNEGLAEFFSTLRVSGSGYQLGGDLPARTQTLERNRWLPLTELFTRKNDAADSYTKRDADIFYAESWALADMLVASPEYADRFRELIAELARGAEPAQAFHRVYGQSLQQVSESLSRWMAQPRSARSLLEKPFEAGAASTSSLSTSQAAALLAQLALVSGHLEQARIRYEHLLREAPDDPDVRAALGTLALRQGRREEALEQWRLAIKDKVTDAQLCYRYALLAEEAGMSREEIKGALQRAVSLAPGFEDARYKLALLQLAEGEYQSAAEHLHAIPIPRGERRYAYWIALASAYVELDQRDEAKQAAQEAWNAAQTDADRIRARQLAYTAATDLTVQFATDADGHSQMVTTRVPHGTTDWNPFVESSDHLQRAEGFLGEVLCTAGKLSGFVLRTGDGALTVEVLDPLHVLMRNSPSEFYCGPTSPKNVEADYAVMKAAGKTSNILRGMTFR